MCRKIVYSNKHCSKNSSIFKVYEKKFKYYFVIRPFVKIFIQIAFATISFLKYMDKVHGIMEKKKKKKE